MYESKGMEITSAALELKHWWVEKREKRGSEALGKPASVSFLETFEEN